MFRLKVIILPFFEPGLMQVRGHYFVDSHGRALGEIPLGQRGSLCLINQTHKYLAEWEP